MANFGPVGLTAEIRSGVCGTPANFNGFAYWLHYCSDVAHRRPTNFARSLAVSCAATLYVYIFGGSYSGNGILPAAKFILRQSLAFSYSQRYCTALPQRPFISQTLRRGIWNGITELSQRAPPIFGWAAITLDIGAHASYYCPAAREQGRAVSLSFCPLARLLHR